MTNYDMNREIREARAAGARALNSLPRAQKALDSASGWGIADLLGGGGIVGMVKHVKLDEAREALEDARFDLELFNDELGDTPVPTIDISDFLTFADFFFDGFLADVMVQSRIGEARKQVARACAQVEASLRRLNG